MLITTGGERDWRKFFAPGFHVTLDGVIQTRVIRADDEEGFVVRYRTDAHGNMLNNGVTSLTERVSGEVVFTGTRLFSTDHAISAAQDKRARRRARNCRVVNRADVRAGGVS
jgi:hypothetical protein